jgi:hypothetical protein
MGTKLRPLLLAKWSDPYTMGAFCKKTNTVEYATKLLKWMETNQVKRDLFFRGLANAHDVALEDLAYEISLVRNAKPEQFDNFIKQQKGREMRDRLVEIVEEATDWESEQQIAAGLEIRDEGIEQLERMEEVI